MTKKDYIDSVEKIEPSADFYEKTEQKMLEALNNRKPKRKIINIAKISAMAAGFALLCAWALIFVSGNNFKLTAENSTDAVAMENTEATAVAEETVHDLLTNDMQGAPLMPDYMIEDDDSVETENLYINGESYEITSPAYNPDYKDMDGAQTAVEVEEPTTMAVMTTADIELPDDVVEMTTSVTRTPVDNAVVDNVPVATMPTAYYEPIMMEYYQKGNNVVINYINNSGQTIETGYDYFLYKVDGGKSELQEVVFIEILMILPNKSDITIKINAKELADGEYLVKKMFTDIDYTAEVSFRVENGVAVFPGK